MKIYIYKYIAEEEIKIGFAGEGFPTHVVEGKKGGESEKSVVYGRKSGCRKRR